MTRNPPCRDCGTRARQGAIAVQAEPGIMPSWTIRELASVALPIHYCQVCAMFNRLHFAIAGENTQVLGHDMVPCTPCNGNSPGPSDRPA